MPTKTIPAKSLTIQFGCNETALIEVTIYGDELMSKALVQGLYTFAPSICSNLPIYSIIIEDTGLVLHLEHDPEFDWRTLQ